MTRGFVRIFWGDPEKVPSTVTGRDRQRTIDIATRSRKEVMGNIANQIKGAEPFTTYVFGDQNAKTLKEIGLQNIVLAGHEPFEFDPYGQMFGHKLKALTMAASDFDEFIFLDWDCTQDRLLPHDFWSELGKKAEFQACLIQYHLSSHIS